MMSICSWCPAAIRLASNITAFLAFGAFAGFVFAGSLLMQFDMGYSPTRTGLAWLATSLTAFVAAATAGQKLVTVLGVRRMVTIGASLVGGAGAWMSRDAGSLTFAVDLWPAWLMGGLGIGFMAPALQIGALTDATGRTEGLAAGLVEIMREIGGAFGVAMVSTVLASRTASGTADGGAVAFVVPLVMALGAVLVVSLLMPEHRATLATTLSSGQPMENQTSPVLTGVAGE